jgi:hypothetical protein
MDVEIITASSYTAYDDCFAVAAAQAYWSVAIPHPFKLGSFEIRRWSR